MILIYIVKYLLTKKNNLDDGGYKSHKPQHHKPLIYIACLLKTSKHN